MYLFYIASTVRAFLISLLEDEMPAMTPAMPFSACSHRTEAAR